MLQQHPLPSSPSGTHHIPRKTARDAAVRFVQQASFGWGRRELVAWLVCHYGPCVIPSDVVPSDQDGTMTAGGSKHERHERPARITECTIVELVCEARESVLRLLVDLGDRSRAEGIGRLMIATGAVVAVRDWRGAGVAYTPANLPRMRLADRVASLFVADYLNAPFDYKNVRICGSCGAVVYEMSRPDGCCAGRESHVALPSVSEVALASSA